MVFEKHKETIKCPQCGKIQLAEVLHTSPLWPYAYNCINCDYIIMESEFKNINAELKDEMSTNVEGESVIPND